MLFRDARRALDHAAGDVPVFTEGYDVAGARAAARELAARGPREDVGRTTEIDADGVRCRLYVPSEARPGLVLHLHGGGFVFNDIDVHDGAARRLANRTGRAVLSVDYRLAPEHPFPAARDDVDTVLAWLDRAALTELGGSGRIGGEGAPLFAHGDSAGANLALVAALRDPERFAALALIYPFLDPTADHESHRTETEGFDPREVEWYWQQYAGGDASLLEHPDLAPLRSTALGTLPPTLVVTAEHDPLRDEGEALARALDRAGVDVVASRYLGQVHGFWRHDQVFVAAEPLMRQVASFVDLHG